MVQIVQHNTVTNGEPLHEAGYLRTITLQHRPKMRA